MFGANMPLILDEIVGVWKIGMTGVAYTGFPFNINTGTNNSGTNGNSQRANHYTTLKIVIALSATGSGLILRLFPAP
jgi:hypothetical protein